jgi:hypothetical protein
MKGNINKNSENKPLSVNTFFHTLKILQRCDKVLLTVSTGSGYQNLKTAAMFVIRK